MREHVHGTSNLSGAARPARAAGAVPIEFAVSTSAPGTPRVRWRRCTLNILRVCGPGRDSLAITTQFSVGRIELHRCVRKCYDASLALRSLPVSLCSGMEVCVSQAGGLREWLSQHGMSSSLLKPWGPSRIALDGVAKYYLSLESRQIADELVCLVANSSREDLLTLALHHPSSVSQE